MMVYIFTPAKRVRRIIPTAGVTDLVHDEADYTLYATVGMEYGVINGEHLGFMCVDGRFRLFTVTKAENFDDNHTTIITGKDAIVLELMEMIVENLQQLDVQLIPAIQGLLDASGTTDAWTVTGAQPERLEKSRAYYTDLWTMLETYKALYEWQIIPYYTFSGGQISGRVIEVKADVAEFRGRILTSKKDASNVYVIKTNPPITRLYVLGPAEGTEDEPKNMSIEGVTWSISSGDPADKPKGQKWIEDPAAVAKYGVHAAVVQINDAEDEDDLIEKGWKHLQTVKEPRSTVEATVQDLERVKGYENHIIRLGDLVPIRLTNATMEAARVINVKRDYIRPSLTKVIIGDKEATIQSQVSTLMADATHTFERLTIFKNRFHEDEALIQLNAEMIQLNAEVIEMNAEEIRMNAEKIEMNAELIDMKAGKEEVTDLGSRVTAAEILIDGINAEIKLKAAQADVTAMETRLSSAEIRIDGAEAAIELKAEQSTVTAMEQRLSQAEIDIDGANAQINLKASQSTVDALGERVSSAEIKIDGANSSIELLANEIKLAGYVTAEELDAAVSDVENAYATYIMTNEIDAGTGEFGTLIVSGSAAIPHGSFGSIELDGTTLSTSSLSMGTLVNTSVISPNDINLAHSHAVTVDGGTVTLGEVSSTGGSFNMADTTFFKDAVSAAKKEGQESVTLTFMGWTNGVATVEASNGKTETVSLPAFSVSGGDTFSSNKTTVYFSTASVNGPLASKTVDATSVYNAGYAAAEVTDITRGNATYYADSKTYTFPITVTSANGETKQEYFGLIATEAYDAGYAGAAVETISVGSSNYNSANKMYLFTVTVTSADGTTTQESFGISAQAAYDAGYNAGYAAGEAAGGGTPSVSISNTSIGSDNKLTVYAFDTSSGLILANKTIDVSSVYDKGVNSVTLSASGWVSNVNTISASNGQSMIVTRSYSSATTVSSGDSVFVSYNGAMVNATYRSGGSKLTYISSVSVGYGGDG